MATLTQTTAIPADHYDGGKNLHTGHNTKDSGLGTLAEIQERQRADVAAVNTEAAANTTKTAALGAENTDGQMGIDILNGVAGSGTWTPTMQSGGPRLRRTAHADAQDFWVQVPLPARTAASKGRKVTGLAVNYEVNTADVEDVRAELHKVTLGADGAARTKAVLGGEADAHYDSAHDTPTKRGDDTAAPELHRAVVTLPSPAYLAADEQLWLRLFVDGDAGAAGVVDFTAAQLLFDETLVDLS